MAKNTWGMNDLAVAGGEGEGAASAGRKWAQATRPLGRTMAQPGPKMPPVPGRNSEQLRPARE